MAVTSFVEELEKQLKCPSCKEIFTNPKTLICLHTFCFRCVTKDQKICLLNNNQGFTCPRCNLATDLSEANPLLQSSSHINALLYLFYAIKGKETSGRLERPLCCACCQKTPKSLTGFCAQCSGMVCTECVNVHKTKKHKTHQVVMLQEFKEDDLESYIRTQMLCQEKFHGKSGVKKIEYFCDGCKRCICRRCSLLEHRKHKLLSMGEVLQNVEKDTNEDIAKLDQLTDKLGKELKESKKQMSRVDNEIKVAKQKVHNAVEALIKKCREHEDTMIKALDKRLNDYQTTNTKEQSDIEEKKKQLEDFKSRCKTMIDKNKWELLSIQKDLKNFCQTFIERSSTVMSKADTKRNVTLHYVTDYVICQSVKDMGKIVESVTDQSHCSMESLNEARYGFVNDLDYITRSSQGDMSMATRWKRTFLWSKSKSSAKEKPPRIIRAYSVS